MANNDAPIILRSVGFIYCIKLLCLNESDILALHCIYGLYKYDDFVKIKKIVN